MYGTCIYNALYLVNTATTVYVNIYVKDMYNLSGYT